MDALLTAVTHGWFRDLLTDLDHRHSLMEMAAVERDRARQAASDALRLESLAPEALRMMIRRSRNGCWIWQGPMNSKGYGLLSYRGESRLAHRLSYETYAGPIPEGLVIDHLCRTPPCINPEHLEAVTQATNSRRGLSANMAEYPANWRKR